MQENEFDLKTMFQKANEFFSKMGLIEIPQSFWNNSIFEKPDDGKNISCDATSWDFYDGKVTRKNDVIFSTQTKLIYQSTYH